MDALPDLPDGRPLKGRGAVSNPTGRFEAEVRQRIDDGWHGPDGRQDGETGGADRVRTRILVDSTRTALTRNSSLDVPFDRSINPYRGCEHGCIYCFARPSHAWLGLSPGLDFETRILAKPDAPALLAQELRRKKYRCRPIAMGTNTDPYQPAERRLKITRKILEVLNDFNHPVTIVTKSDAVLRDIDILADMASRRLAHVALSVTTLDGALARKLEPRTATPTRRLAALTALEKAGVPAAVMVAPVIPGLTDREIESILEAAAKAGARKAGYILLRLPHEVKTLFSEWLESHFPDRAAHVLSLVRDTREGTLNDAAFGRRMRGTGAFAAMIEQRFRLASRRHGFHDTPWPALETGQFRPPAAEGDQLSLF